MALSNTRPTLSDLKALEGPDGKIGRVMEIIAEENDVLEEAVMLEANDGSTNLTNLRTGYSQPTWRKLYGGVQPSTGSTTQVRDGCGELTDYFQADKKLVDKAKDPAQFMLVQNADKMHAFGIEIAGTIFRGNEDTDDAQFTGLLPRFDDKNAPNGSNIIVGPASGSPQWRSMWVIGWGPSSVHLIYPEGSKAGLDMQFQGQKTLQADYSVTTKDGGGQYEGYQSYFCWETGLAVPDWRYIVRIQYDQAGLTKDASAGADLLDMVSEAIEMLPQGAVTRKALYCNARGRSWFRRQATNAIRGSTLSWEMVAGKRVLMLDELPVRRCDALNAGETLVQNAA